MSAGLVLDITERLIQEVRLRQSQKMLAVGATRGWLRA